MTARVAIADGLVNLIKDKLNGSEPTKFWTNLYGNVSRDIYKFEEIKEFPYVGIHIGPESFEYEPSRQQWIFLDLSILIYEKDRGDLAESLEKLIGDIKTLIDSEDDLTYTIHKPDGTSVDRVVTQRTINSVNTDEGLLSPYGFAEISVTFRYREDKRLY